jgi:hypothetical protein
VVNFINILPKNSSYERLFGSFFHLNVTREKLPKKGRSYEKFAHQMLMKLTPGIIMDERRIVTIFEGLFSTMPQ